MPVNIAANYPNAVSTRTSHMSDKVVKENMSAQKHNNDMTRGTKEALEQEFKNLAAPKAQESMTPLITRDQTALQRNLLSKDEKDKAKVELQESREELMAKKNDFVDLDDPNSVASQFVSKIIGNDNLIDKFEAAYDVKGPHAKSKLEEIAKQNAQAYFEELLRIQEEEQRRALTNKYYQDYLTEKSLEYLRESLGASDKEVTDLLVNKDGKNSIIPPGTRLSVGDMFHKTYITTQIDEKTGALVAEFDPRDPAARSKILDLIVAQNPPPGRKTTIKLGATITATQAIGGVSPQNDLPTRKAAIDLLIKSSGIPNYRATVGSTIKHSMNPLSDIMISEPANDPDKLLRDCFEPNPETGKRDKLKSSFKAHLDPKEYHDFCLQYRKWGGRRPEIEIEGLALDPKEKANLDKLNDLWDVYSQIYEANQKRPSLDLTPNAADKEVPRPRDEISFEPPTDKVRAGERLTGSDEISLDEVGPDKTRVGEAAATDEISLQSETPSTPKSSGFSSSGGSS
ncbi:MAG: hypothetical protein AB7F64_08965 [Gammaproteobacteria bacterium]